MTAWTPLGDHLRHTLSAQAGLVKATAGVKGSSESGPKTVPTLTLCGGPCGEFVDFGLLPALVSEPIPEGDGRAISRWAGSLDEWGFDFRHIDPEGGQTASAIAAEGAWRLANRIGLIRERQATEAGRAIAALAGIEAEARQEALAPLLRPGVEAALAGQGGKPIILLLERTAQAFERLTCAWLTTDPVQTQRFKRVDLLADWAAGQIDESAADFVAAIRRNVHVSVRTLDIVWGVAESVPPVEDKGVCK